MGEGHVHTSTPLSGVRVRGWLNIAVAVVAVATVIGLVVLRPSGSGERGGDVLGAPAPLVDGRVLSADEVTCGPVGENEVFCALTRVALDSGRDKGETITLELPLDAGSPVLDVGDKIVLSQGEPGEGDDPSLGYVFADFQRDRPLLLLSLLFAVVVVALARWRGVRALAGLGISLVVIAGFVLPSILDGRNPVAVAVVGSSLVMLVAIYLVHGLRPQTTVAVLGTTVSLGLTGILAVVFVNAARITGLATEEASFLQVSAGQVNLRGLVLAGVIIGTLGVLDDVTVTQVSAVWQLRAASPEASATTIYRRAISIGRDHIASTVNTLVLAYAGASLPLLILFSQAGRSVVDAGTAEIVGTEIVRTLVGGIGLVAAVPVTTALAVAVVTDERRRTTRRDQAPRSGEA